MFYLTMHSTHFIYGYMASENIKTVRNSLRSYPKPENIITSEVQFSYHFETS